jgi:hypothetical protein
MNIEDSITTITVPETPGPKKQLCYQTPPLDGSRGNPMIHCDRAIKHAGRHSWEIDQDAARLELANQVIAAWQAVIDHTAKIPQGREPMNSWVDERGPLLADATQLTKAYGDAK